MADTSATSSHEVTVLEVAALENDAVEPAKANVTVRAWGRTGTDTAGGRDASSGDRHPLPVRVIVQHGEGQFADGSGRGTYRDGRFFADHQFQLSLPAGESHWSVSAGPHYRPHTWTLATQPGQRLMVDVELVRWIDPTRWGWYAGDNHVHAQHDRQAEVRTSYGYAALQARANGLSFMTEAGSDGALAQHERDDIPADVLVLSAGEQRPGPFVGHVVTPGLRTPLASERWQQLVRRPLPVQAIVPAVHATGGAVVHTHLLTPRHQLHWMGAAEAYSDAVTGRCADAWDVDGRHAELLWFAGLNLGNRIAVSSYTDAALGRRQTLSPGDRRIYCHVPRLEWKEIVAAIRAGRTMATNGGPIFARWTINGAGPGETVAPRPADTLRVEVTTYSEKPLRAVEVFSYGKRVHAWPVAERERVGEHTWTCELNCPPSTDQRWFVLRVEDVEGHWLLSSPIYVPASSQENNARHAVLVQISNATRFIELRRAFFWHAILTVGTTQKLTSVALLRDGREVQVWQPASGDTIAAGQIPVTGATGEYAAGHVWFPDGNAPYHFQVDWPVDVSGWYQLAWQTEQGGRGVSDRLYFAAEHPRSRQLSAARLEGPRTLLRLWGYGEEMPLDEIEVPFAGDHWWYPRETYSLLQADLDGQTYRYESAADHPRRDWFGAESFPADFGQGRR